MHDPAVLKRAAAAAVRACGEALSWQFEAWPAGAGDCAGLVLGPGRHLLDAPAFEASLCEVGGLRCGVVAFEAAQAILAVEVIGPEAVAGLHDGGGAALARALRAPTGPGEYMVVVLLEEGAAVVPVTPLTARGGAVRS